MITMTALGLLAIYCIAIFVIYVVRVVNTYFNDTTLNINNLMYAIFALFIICILAYGLGWLFIIIVKWIMLQFGIVASTDMVYAVIYIILSLLNVIQHN